MDLDSYLHENESVDITLTKKRLFRGKEQLAATESRIIHAGPRGYSDIQYPFIASINDYYILRWRWAKTGLYLLFIAIACLGISLYAPGVSQDVARGTTDYTNNLSEQLYSSIIPRDLLSGMAGIEGQPDLISGMGGQPGASAGIPSFETSLPDASSIGSLIDFGGPIKSAGDNVGYVTGIIGPAVAAMAGLCFLLFVVTARRAILIKTIVGDRAFYFGNESKERRREFVKAVNARITKSRYINSLSPCGGN